MVPKCILLVVCCALCFSSPASQANHSNDRSYRLARRVFLKVVETGDACNAKPSVADRDPQCRRDLQFENDSEYNVHVTLRIRTRDGGAEIRESTEDYWLKPGYLYCGDEIRAGVLVELSPLIVEQTDKDPGRQIACRHVR